MKRKVSILVSVLFLLTISAMLAQPSNVWAQSERTVGLISRDLRASEGYTLFRPMGIPAGGPVYLINNAGNPVHKWTKPLPTRPGGEVFLRLRENGELVLTTDIGAHAIDWDGGVVWEIDSEGLWFGHHECVELPNGNLLLPGFIEKTRAEAENAGFNVIGADACQRGPLEVLRVDNLWEVAPTDPECGFKCGWEVVWNWNLWDHIVQDDNYSKLNYVTNIADHPGKVDIGYDDPAGGVCSQYIQGAWTFGRYNALSYNAKRDEIVMSASLFNEIQIIDHSIPSSELIYRWGNPYAYGAGDPFVDADNRGDQKLSFQHRAHWIAPGLPGKGNILIFNNGQDWGDSSVIEIKPPRNYKRKRGQPFGPKKPKWQYDEYDTPGSFFAPFISSAQRLPNGNTLINDGPAGYFFEVKRKGDKVWEYINPSAAQGGAAFFVYRAWRYAPDFPGLAGKDLTPGDPIEIYDNVYFVDIIPGSCENPVNRKSKGRKSKGRKSKGVLPVAILGSEDLDVATIDPSSILLEGFPPVKWSIEDVSTLDECDGRDGYPDLVLKWDSDDIKVALGNVSKGDEILLRLTGYSDAGWFLGREEVRIVK